METGTFRVKAGLAEMLKGGVIMDVVTADQAKIAEDAGAAAVLAVPGAQDREVMAHLTARSSRRRGRGTRRTRR